MRPAGRSVAPMVAIASQPGGRARRTASTTSEPPTPTPSSANRTGALRRSMRPSADPDGRGLLGAGRDDGRPGDRRDGGKELEVTRLVLDRGPRGGTEQADRPAARRGGKHDQGPRGPVVNRWPVGRLPGVDLFR